MSKILIADEQPLIRHAIRQVLEAQGHSIIAELDDGADALRQTLRLEPSLLILDLVLPRFGGLEVIQRLRQQGSKVPILVLTAQSSEHFAGLCINQLDDELSAGIAGAMAMAALPQPHSPGASMTSVGMGNFRGESTVAVGVSTLSKDGKWVMKLQGSADSQGEVGVSVGVGYQWE